MRLIPVAGLAALCVEGSTLVGGVGLLVELTASAGLGKVLFSGALFGAKMLGGVVVVLLSLTGFLSASSKTIVSGIPSC